jgi:hypothetical protein
MIVWESDNAGAISVDNTGMLTVNTYTTGAAVITATVGSMVRSVTVGVAEGRFCFSFANTFAPWTVTTAGASVASSDGAKTTILMNNAGTTSKRRGDINLVTNNSGVLLSIMPSTYRYVALKFTINSLLQVGNNAVGCIKLELFDNPRTIGPEAFNTAASGPNNRYTVLTGDFLQNAPNVLYYDLQGNYATMPTVWTNPFSLVQFKFVIADYPADGTCDTYDIYWVHTFKTVEELQAFVNAGN